MCSNSVLKYLLVFISILILCAGAAALAVGIWTIVDKPLVQSILDAELHDTSAYLMIVAGIIVIIISLLGCCGAARADKCKLLTFAIILCIAFGLMLAGAILGYIYTDKVETKLRGIMSSSIPKYGESNTITDLWNTIHAQFQCCGIKEGKDDSYAIWKKKNPRFTSGDTIPNSCCKKKDPESIKTCQKSPSTEAYNADCYSQMKAFMKNYAYILAGVATAVCIIFILGILIACTLFCRI